MRIKSIEARGQGCFRVVEVDPDAKTVTGIGQLQLLQGGNFTVVGKVAGSRELPGLVEQAKSSHRWRQRHVPCEAQLLN